MSMLNDIVWDAKGNFELCVTIKEYAQRFLRGHWSCLGPTELTIANQMDLGFELQRKMLQNFAGSGHPIFRCTSAVKRRGLGSKGGGKTSMHFNGSTQNIGLLLQMVISVNQLSLYGAVADMIEELPVGQRAPGKPATTGQLDKQEIRTQALLAEMQANEERQETCCKNTSNDLKNCQKTRIYPDYASKQV